MRASFCERLLKVMHEGNLTVADLARLFGRPYPTVRGWVQGAELGGAPLDAALVMAQLEKLERRIKARDKLPVPRLHPSERIAYVDKLRNVR